MNIFSSKPQPNMTRPDSRELPESVKNTLNKLKEETPEQILQNNSRNNKISGMKVEIVTVQKILINGQVVQEIPIKAEHVDGDLIW